MASSTLFISPLLKGFGMGGSLIVAIGAQNAFVLKQGLLRNHLFLTASLCFFFDSILIILGVKGLGAFITDSPILLNVLRYSGSLFLLAYGTLSFRSAFKANSAIVLEENNQAPNFYKTIAVLTAFTLLNPHAYIDAFLILGGIGAQQPAEMHFSFIFGALLASFIWFYGLSFGASKLTPLFSSKRAWQFLDALIGIIMYSIALSLLFCSM